MPEVPRSMHATSAPEAAAVARRRRSLPHGVWGMIIFAGSEAALFGSVIAAYFYLRVTSTEWPQGAIEPPSVALPLALTAGLIVTALAMAAAARAAGAGRLAATRALVGTATLAQGGYLAVQIVSYLGDLDAFSPSDNAYASVYFTMLGAHHAHVAAGLALNAWLLARLVAGLTDYRVNAVRVAAIYWLFVAAIAVPVVVAQVWPA